MYSSSIILYSTGSLWNHNNTMYNVYILMQCSRNCNRRMSLFDQNKKKYVEFSNSVLVSPDEARRLYI